MKALVYRQAFRDLDQGRATAAKIIVAPQ